MSSITRRSSRRRTWTRCSCVVPEGIGSRRLGRGGGGGADRLRGVGRSEPLRSVAEQEPRLRVRGLAGARGARGSSAGGGASAPRLRPRSFLDRERRDSGEAAQRLPFFLGKRADQGFPPVLEHRLAV